MSQNLTQATQIERSINDGKTWELIAEIPGDTDSGKEKSFNDDPAPEGGSQYRLRTVNTYGNSEYSYDWSQK